MLHSLEEINEIFAVSSCIDVGVNLGNLPRFVNNDGNALAHVAWSIGSAEKQAKVAPAVYKQWKIQAMLLYESLMRLGVLDTDSENLRIMEGKYARLIPE